MKKRETSDARREGPGPAPGRETRDARCDGLGRETSDARRDVMSHVSRLASLASHVSRLTTVNLKGTLS